MPLLARRERGLEENPLPPVPRRLILVGQRELQFRLLFSTHQRLLYDQERPRHERSCAGRLPGCEACSSSPRARGSPTRLAPINHERRPYFGSVCFYERHRVSPAASSARSLSRRRRAQALLTLREVPSPPTLVLPKNSASGSGPTTSSSALPLPPSPYLLATDGRSKRRATSSLGGCERHSCYGTSHSLWSHGPGYAG